VIDAEECIGQVYIVFGVFNVIKKTALAVELVNKSIAGGKIAIFIKTVRLRDVE